MLHINHQIKETILPSGIKIVSIEVPQLPYSIIAAGFQSGSRFDPPNKSGLAHLSEHLFMGSTIDFPVLEKRLTKLESLGISFNAVTHREIVLFYHTQLEDYLQPSLQLFWNGLSRTVVSKSKIEQEKSVIIDEYQQDLDVPQYLIWRQAAKILWPESSLAQPITGTPHTLKNIHPKDIKACHQIQLNPSRAVYFVIGSKQEVKTATKFFTKKLANHNAIQPNTAITPSLATSPKNSTGKNIIFCRQTSSQNQHVNIGIFFKTTSIFNEKDRVALSFIKSYLADSWIARLIQKLRIKHKLTYWVNADSEYFSDTGYLEFQFSTSRKSIFNAIELTLQECKKLKKQKLSNQNIAPHKTSMTAEIMKGILEPENLLTWYYEEALLSAKMLDYKTFISAINALDGKTIQGVAQKYLTPENIAIVISTPELGSLKKKLADLVAKL